MQVADVSIRILHVDDEPDFAKTAATFVEREDDRFTVETATSASRGLERLAADDFDCVVSDYDMPGLNGIEFLEAVREDHSELPFILYTGKGSEEVASDAISAGVTDYIQKGSGTSQYTVLAHRIGNAVETYRTRQAVEETEQKLSQLAEKTDDILFMFDGDWSDLLFINSAYEDIWGEPVEELEADPESFLERVHREDREKVRRTMDRLSNGDPDEIEYRVVRADGDQRWVRGQSKPIFDDDGDVARIVGFVRDVTDRKEREHRLREEQQFVRSIFDALPDPLYAFDMEGYPIRWNEQLEEVTGYPADEIEEMHVTEFVPEGEIETIAANFRTILEERRSVTVESTVETSDGDRIPYEFTGGPLEDADGTLRGVTGVGRDVTERKEREHRLEALNGTTRDLMAAESREEVAEIGVDAASEILGLDANAAHLYDDDRSRLVPVAATDTTHDLIGELPTFTGEDSIAWRVYERGEALALDDVHDDPDVYNPDTPVQSELHLPIAEHGILIAGSESLEAFDEQDVVLGEILVGNVAAALEQVERTEQLRARERELTRQNERLEEFARIVSHDLRNPLTVAKGRLELARDDCEGEHLDDAVAAIERSQALIDDMLTLAREGEQLGDIEAVALADVVEECWQNVETADATLSVDTERTVRADPGRLQQLLENLFRNAVEHGGDDVSVTVGELDGGFYVADDGPGVPADERERIFEAGYSRAEASTGFGLAIVERIAGAHGWEIHATDGESGGARFEITGVEVRNG